MTDVKNCDIIPELLINLKDMYLERNIQEFCEAQVRVLKGCVKLIKKASKKLECYASKFRNNHDSNSLKPLSKKAVAGVTSLNSSRTNSFTDKNYLVDPINAIELGATEVQVSKQNSSIRYYYEDFDKSISLCYQRYITDIPQPPFRKKSVYEKPKIPEEITNENDIIKTLCEKTGYEYRPDQYDLVSFVNFYVEESRSMLEELGKAKDLNEIDEPAYTNEIEKLYNNFDEIQKVIKENKKPLHKGVFEEVNITLKELNDQFLNIIKNRSGIKNRLTTINLQTNRGMMR